MTEWWALVHPGYPWGDIGIYPAKEGGIARTFPHQYLNAPGPDDVPWRRGWICVSTEVRVLGREGPDDEPRDADARLAWNIARALEWLRLASRGELARPGDPFELPWFPLADADRVIVSSEGPESLARWVAVRDQAGLVDLVELDTGINPVTAVTCFRSRGGESLMVPSWGSLISSKAAEAGKRRTGAWIRLPDVPVRAPWEAPATWGELREVGTQLGVSVDGLLQRVAPFLRDGEQHLLLVGFPIPRAVGGPEYARQWQALELPVLTLTGTAVPGFRANERGYWTRDRARLLPSDRPMAWIASENWHPTQLGTRGKLSDAALARKVVLIGAGALGSALAELLVRTGLEEVTVVDGDELQAGNLVRHTLGLQEVGGNKAFGVAWRLNRVSPHARIEPILGSFPLSGAKDLALLATCDVVLDTTGSDDVLGHMARFPWQGEKLFVSASLGYGARRLFCFVVHGSQFPHQAFSDAFRPWRERERVEAGPFPMETVGCWNPVAPARADDVWLLAAAAVRAIEPRLVAPAGPAELIVLEQWEQDGAFAGIRRAALA